MGCLTVKYKLIFLNSLDNLKLKILGDFLSLMEENTDHDGSITKIPHLINFYLRLGTFEN